MPEPETSPTRPSSPPPLSMGEVSALTGAELSPPGADALEVTGLTLSSQRVCPGDVYAALPGARAHGATYVAQAVAAGAVAVLTDAEGAATVRRVLAEEAPGLEVPLLVAERPRALLGTLASRVYADPARALTLLAVTGTQGKTTTTRLLEGGLTAAGVSAGVVGTVGTRIAGEDVRSTLTTPEAPDLHALFAVMVERGVEACAMEVSSHALVMGRVDGVVFDAAAFLNLGRDHLDFHRDLEDYFAAKASLFTPERTQRGLTNVDDEFGRRLLRVATVPMATFSATGADADWRAVDVVGEPGGSEFTVLGPHGLRVRARVPIPGAFNVANALCAIAVAGEAGLDPEVVARGISASGGVPGRLERVDAGQPWLAVVDYAHKPDAVQAAMDTLRPLTRGRLVLVMGAGGDRDTGKRPVMGEIGARLADVLVVTDDNPRSEDPAAIRAALLAGAAEVPSAERAEVVEVDGRREAIRRAVALAGPGDTVVVAGKGHETGQEVAGQVHPFDDRDELRAAIEGALR
ncbi:UDP-N-acetylmuramoylalanyl-D-glutamate--2,6-diaminopimelate ligase [Marmoricola sp. Leaf446]|uniref:UDP-N-acetylmuramoyl-L-alanyl-D-glutamate--2, 6-diaminopimelate ligase n=1 Tax=Marmoricola sp. Leaf446 TaxID=1736379 RepID=UPI0007006345|nr:UDP-N-acetylmuramoyl-L-alanyl-D-glutamate--2,6-diaminopimelate ligase [Marmoricola sp. Leaf446]KQT91161.1 UDP-N-acetylmuramoylalanyl-D-glutamate--2,6-diaminopimelate ligase [Marmoricola sp. Leaf446]